jgi:hypothetical protein
MLAGTEEALQAGRSGKIEEEMTAIHCLLAGLFDYAGLYPPAGLDLRQAVNNYLEYRRSEHASALGRFVINIERLDELRSLCGESIDPLRLSIIASEDADWASLARHIGDGLAIETVEVKCNRPAVIDQIARKAPSQLVTIYFEVPINESSHAALEAIPAAGARAKIRMGGLVPDAFPSIADVIQMLGTLARLRLPFKATAGLHHPVRSLQPLTYQPDGPTGVMHGFVNLCCAAALIFSGGEPDEARRVLTEEDPAAWHVTADAVGWRNIIWSADQLSSVRQNFLIGIGSCSFEEPIRDLESLGWL